MIGTPVSKFGRISAPIIKFIVRFYTEIMIVVIVAILLGGYCLFLSKDIKQIFEEREFSLTSIKAHETYLQGYLASLEKLNKNYMSFTEQQLVLMQSILPKRQDFPSLFVQFQDLAEKNKFSLSSINLIEVPAAVAAPVPVGQEQTGSSAAPANAAPLPADLIRQVNITISVSGGDYFALKRFLADIEANMRLFDVVMLNFGSAQEGPYQINLKTYFSP